MKIQYDHFYNESVFRELSDKYHVPGFTYTIIKKGRAEETRAFGIRNVDPVEPMTADTIFEAASLTKTLFALIVMRLKDRGVIDLDDHMAELAPEVKVSDDDRSRECTVRQALCHNTGIRGWGDRPHVLFESDPGTAYAYSGEGYYWLQRVLEQYTGRDFCQSMEEEILKPLGMKDSYPVMCPELLKKESHKFDRDGIMQPFRTWVDLEGAAEPNAAWSLYSTAGDYAKFMLEIMNEKGHLNVESFDQMTGLQNKACEATDWGLGWGIALEDPGVIWHWGDNGCYRSFAAMDLETKDGLCIFCNGELGGKLCMELVRLLTGDAYWEDIERFIDTAE